MTGWTLVSSFQVTITERLWKRTCDQRCLCLIVCSRPVVIKDPLVENLMYNVQFAAASKPWCVAEFRVQCQLECRLFI
ncbi:hypothetical protein TNCV_2411421 [Trichonephila clavipes]|nr:hypothetical protein TNCV_2411421 [Trichonephila clavipes]